LFFIPKKGLKTSIKQLKYTKKKIAYFWVKFRGLNYPLFWLSIIRPIERFEGRYILQINHSMLRLINLELSFQGA
jgi:hypothetical protein